MSAVTVGQVVVWCSERFIVTRLWNTNTSEGWRVDMELEGSDSGMSRGSVQVSCNVRELESVDRG